MFFSFKVRPVFLVLFVVALGVLFYGVKNGTITERTFSADTLRKVSSSVSFMLRPTVDTWTANVGGIEVTYRRMEGEWSDDLAGHVLVLPGNRCIIRLNDIVFEDKQYLVFVAAHEYGHCVDRIHLGYDHDGITTEGYEIFKDEYFLEPAEGYAEAYSYYYITQCGFATKPLGIIYFEDDSECELPNPRRVKETLVSSNSY